MTAGRGQPMSPQGNLRESYGRSIRLRHWMHRCRGISPDATSSILLNIARGFLAGIALLSFQFGWRFIDKRLNRRVAVRKLRSFLEVWEKETRKNAVNKEFQFVAHELRIRRMNENIEIFRPYLSGGQATDIAGLIRDHEELIEARPRLVLGEGFEEVFPNQGRSTGIPRHLGGSVGLHRGNTDPRTDRGGNHRHRRNQQDRHHDDADHGRDADAHANDGTQGDEDTGPGSARLTPATRQQEGNEANPGS